MPLVGWVTLGKPLPLTQASFPTCKMVILRAPLEGAGWENGMTAASPESWKEMWVAGEPHRGARQGASPADHTRLGATGSQPSRDSHRMRRRRAGGKKSQQAQRQLLGFWTMACSFSGKLGSSEETHTHTH